MTSGSDNLTRFGALESLVNGMADDTWDNRPMNRTSTIQFLEDDEEDDDDKVRPVNFTWVTEMEGRKKTKLLWTNR